MLVDTNVLAELARPRPNAAVVGWLAKQSRIHLSVVTLEEVAFGVARAKGGAHTPSREMARRVARGASAHPRRDARHRARVGRAPSRAGGSWPPRVAMADMLIAATAIAHGLTLATRNVRDFRIVWGQLLCSTRSRAP